MDNQKVGSPRATDSPRRLPDDSATPLSPRSAMPRVLERQRDALLIEIKRSNSLYQTIYNLRESIDAMRAAIAEECAKAAMPSKAQAMLDLSAQVSDALSQADTCFDRTDFASCKIYLEAAKANQVKLLSSVDALKQDPDGDQRFSKAHDQCLELGYTISAMTLLVNERLGQQQQPTSPRSSAPVLVHSPEKQKSQKSQKAVAVPPHSPTRQHAPRSPENEAGRGRLEKMPSPTSGKRAQGDEDSPQFKNSPAKRHKGPAADKTVSSPSREKSGSATAADVQAHTTPARAAKVPKLDWSSAKPAATAPHAPRGTTPRTSRHARTDSKGNEQQSESGTAAPSSPQAPDARKVSGGNDTPASAPTSPSSSRSEARQESPRKGGASPSKSLRPQPRPRPSSMLFMSPPVPSGTAERNEKARGADDSGAASRQAPGVTRAASGTTTATTATTTITTTTTTTDDAGQSMRESADA